MKKGFAIIFALSLITGCTRSWQVSGGGETYKVVQQSSNKKHDKEQLEIAQRMGPFNYPANYISAVREATRPGDMSGTDKASGNPHMTSAMIKGTGVGFEAIKAGQISGFGLTGAAIDLLLGAQSPDATVRNSLVHNYRTISDGSVVIAKPFKDQGVVDALTQGFAELKHLRENVCGFTWHPNASNKIMVRGTRDSHIEGKCQRFNNERALFWVSTTEHIPALQQDFMPGSFMRFVISSKFATPQLVADLKSNLGEGWYVMHAQTLKNAKTGDDTQMYRIWSREGEWAYPLPKAPQFN